jgi:hypothetical protein
MNKLFSKTENRKSKIARITNYGLRITNALLAGIAIVVLLVVMGAWYLFWPRLYTIELRADGFYPPTVTVPAGSTIAFINKTDRPFWPASNFHPSHKLYAEFDAKTIIPVGESWRFAMHRVGLWRYHDHLMSSHGGAIRVRSSPWARSFTCEGEACFIQEIEEVLQKEGIDAAFERFSQLYESNPAFSSTCHDVTHLLGEAAYREYVSEGKIVTTTKTAYCGYGFYHGFIEALLFTTGNFEEAKQYCREVQDALSADIGSPNAIYSCYHGIGHGTFDTQSYSQWGDDRGMLTAALTTCERVTQGDELELEKQCGTGVFNALANAYNNKTYSLFHDDQNPWGICEKQVNVEYKKACFREVAASYIKDKYPQRDRALAIIAQIVDRVGANATMYAYIAELVRLNLDMPIGDWVDSCEAMKPLDMSRSCTEGVVSGLFLWGKPGQEHVNAVAFCDADGLSRANKDACFSYVLPRMRTVYTKQKAEEICKTVNSTYQQYCL